jgi:addiction module HigA family antidote
MSKLEIAPIHPGEVLKKLYFNEINMSAGRLAKELNVPRTRIEQVAECSRALSPDTAIRLAKFFNTTPQFLFCKQTMMLVSQNKMLMFPAFALLKLLSETQVAA